MSLFYLFNFAALFSITIFDTLSRVSLLRTKYIFAYTVLWEIMGGFMAILFLPFDKLRFQLDSDTLVLVGIAIIFLAVSDALMFKAYKYEEESQLASIFPLMNLIAVIFSVYFFKSAIRTTTIYGLLLVLLATVLINLHKQKKSALKGVTYAVLYTIFTGIAIAIEGKIINHFSIVVFIALSFFLPALLNQFIFLRPKIREMKYELKKHWQTIALSAVIINIAVFSLLKALAYNRIPETLSIYAASSILLALVGVTFLKERDHMKIKLIAATIAAVGVVLAQL